MFRGKRALIVWTLASITALLAALEVGSLAGVQQQPATPRPAPVGGNPIQSIRGALDDVQAQLPADGYARALEFVDACGASPKDAAGVASIENP